MVALENEPASAAQHTLQNMAQKEKIKLQEVCVEDAAMGATDASMGAADATKSARYTAAGATDTEIGVTDAAATGAADT